MQKKLQPGDPSRVASFSLVLTRIRGFYVVVKRVQSSQEVGSNLCNTLNVKSTQDTCQKKSQ